mgnify:CR=1 FL=1
MFIDHDSGAASKVQKPWTDAEVFPNCSSLSLRALPCAAAPVTLRTCEHVSRPALRWPGGRHDASCRRGKGAGAGVLRGDRVPQRRAARAPTAWAPSARRRVSPPVGRVGAAALGRLRAGHDGGLQPRALADPPHPHPRRPRVPSPLAAPALCPGPPRLPAHPGAASQRIAPPSSSGCSPSPTPHHRSAALCTQRRWFRTRR